MSSQMVRYDQRLLIAGVRSGAQMLLREIEFVFATVNGIQMHYSSTAVGRLSWCCTA
jgi:hypothetical protein